MAEKAWKVVKGGRRAVVVGGMRTPFAKAFTELMELDTIALGVAAVDALLRKLNISHSDIDSIVWGGVVLPPLSVNIGREIALDLKLPASVEGRTVTRACASWPPTVPWRSRKSFFSRWPASRLPRSPTPGPR